MPEAYMKHPLWRGCGGPPESSGRGRQGERRQRTQEAPLAPDRREDRSIRYPVREARQGNPGSGVKPEPKGTAGTPEQAGGEVLVKRKPAGCCWGVLSGRVLGGGDSPLQGKDLTEVHSLPRNLLPDRESGDNMSQPHGGE